MVKQHNYEKHPGNPRCFFCYKEWSNLFSCFYDSFECLRLINSKFA